MVDAMVKGTAGEITKAFLSRTELVWGKAIDSVIEKLHDGVLAYLEKQQAKFLSAKTFLHREPVYFYDIYFNLSLEFGAKPVQITDYKMAFGENQCLAVIGAAGSGKSTLMKHLFLNVVQKGDYEIPMFIELRRLSGDGNLFDYIEKHALGGGLVITKNGVSKLFEEGKIILFLDGFDEVDSQCFTGLVRSIDDLATKYPKVKFLVTGRPGSRLETLRTFKCARVAPLSSIDIRKFISAQKIGVETESRVLQIIDKISKERKGYLAEYLSNPLLLSLFIITCTTTKQLPDRKSAFYKRVVDTLFVEHDSLSKPDYDRQLKSGLSQVKFEHLLQRFSAISYFNSEFQFNKEYVNKVLIQIFEKSAELKADDGLIRRDLVVGIGLWTEDGGEYSFSHRSLQEYFAAEFISGLESAKKEAVYNKLMTRIRSSEVGEVENFLSLCTEVDEQAYIRFFLLPVIRESRALLDRGTEHEIAARLIKLYYSKVMIDPSNSRSARGGRRKTHVGFGRLSWMYVANSSLIGISHVYGELVKGALFDLLFSNLAKGLEEFYRESGLAAKPLHDSPLPGGWVIYDVERDLSEIDIVRLLDSSQEVVGSVANIKNAFEAEEWKWQKRLSELDFADSCLIKDLL